jgi:hypothetical protein
MQAIRYRSNAQTVVRVVIQNVNRLQEHIAKNENALTRQIDSQLIVLRLRIAAAEIDHVLLRSESDGVRSA